VAYVLTFLEFRLLFNYDFMKGAPVYLASAPHGMFNAILALVFHVTALAVMFLVLCFDLWPLTSSPGIMKHRRSVCVESHSRSEALRWRCGSASGCFGMDPMAFLTGVTVPVHLRYDHHAEHAAELTVRDDDAAGRRGWPTRLALRSWVSCLHIFTWRSHPSSVARLRSGPPGYDLEVWLANAHLSCDVPISHAITQSSSAYWPLTKPAASAVVAKT
jgi:hypothetical protein